MSSTGTRCTCVMTVFVIVTSKGVASSNLSAVSSNMRSSISQNVRLFSAILAKVTHPSNTHVLICICAGEASRHFSAISLSAVATSHNYMPFFKFRFY